MASVESLPADQRAVLQLVLKQGKSYEDLAKLLKIDSAAVRTRAHAGVEALAPEAPELDADERGEIVDYLLSQASASERAATREDLEDSPPGRAWARAAAAALQPLTPIELPEVPSEPAEVAEAFEALDRRTERQAEVKRSSRTGGLLFLAGIGVVLAVILVLVFSAADNSSNGPTNESAGTPTSPATAAPATGGTTPPTTTTPQLVSSARLAPPAGDTSGAAGVAVIAREAGALVLGLQATGLPKSAPGTAYALWLFNPPNKARFLGFVRKPVAADGKLASASRLDQSPDGYGQLLVTRETQNGPTKPGTIILRGVFAVTGVAGTTTTP